MTRTQAYAARLALAAVVHGTGYSTDMIPITVRIPETRLENLPWVYLDELAGMRNTAGFPYATYWRESIRDSMARLQLSRDFVESITMSYFVGSLGHIIEAAAPSDFAAVDPYRHTKTEHCSRPDLPNLRRIIIASPGRSMFPPPSRSSPPGGMHMCLHDWGKNDARTLFGVLPSGSYIAVHQDTPPTVIRQYPIQAKEFRFHLTNMVPSDENSKSLPGFIIVYLLNTLKRRSSPILHFELPLGAKPPKPRATIQTIKTLYPDCAPMTGHPSASAEKLFKDTASSKRLKGKWMALIHSVISHFAPHNLIVARLDQHLDQNLKFKFANSSSDKAKCQHCGGFVHLHRCLSG